PLSSPKRSSLYHVGAAVGARPRQSPKRWHRNSEMTRQIPTGLSNHLHFLLSPRRPRGEGRVRGADVPVCGGPHLTLPTLRVGPLPLPLRGGEGFFSTQEFGRSPA